MSNEHFNLTRQHLVATVPNYNFVNRQINFKIWYRGWADVFQIPRLQQYPAVGHHPKKQAVASAFIQFNMHCSTR